MEEKFKNYYRPLPMEPWGKLADGKELANWNNENEILYNQVIKKASYDSGKYILIY